ncbi:hypothetical protein [Alkaliphilus transvaalensis]|uniref:hypothetical protein n=1 Tax=Alkaliphilus transvaalensis TaxID=114628 RepID=UPI00047BDE45|nr:hypothetical protein [Alkaliphilus transvaalensis]
MFKKKLFGISLIIACILIFIIPGKLPEAPSGGMFRYEYGFPLRFITLHQYNPTSRWLMTNLISGNRSIAFDPVTLVINGLIIYYLIGLFFPFSESLKEKSPLKDKKLFKYLGLLFITILLNYKLPHNSNSIIQYIIPDITNGTRTLHISSFPILILFAFSIGRLFDLPRFKEHNKILLFIVVIVVVIPLMVYSINFSRTAFHTIAGSELSALDCDFKNSSIDFNHINDDEAEIKVRLELIDYTTKDKAFKVNVHIPDQWKLFFGVEYFQLPEMYTTEGHNKITIEEVLYFEIGEGYKLLDVLNFRWRNETFYYELYNDEERIMLKDHGQRSSIRLNFLTIFPLINAI